MGQILVPGTAGAADVLAGKKFSAGVLYDGAGTMPNRAHATLGGGYVTAVSALADQGGNIIMEPPTGYYTTGKNANGYGSLLANSPDLVPLNVPANKNIFGMQGSIPVRDNVNGTGWAPNVNHHSPSEIAAWDQNLFVRPNGAGGTGKQLYEGDCWIRVNDPDFIPSNIRLGVNIFGHIGTMIPGKRIAAGTMTSSQSRRPFQMGSSQGQMNYFFEITGHGFQPDIMFCWGMYDGYNRTISAKFGSVLGQNGWVEGWGDTVYTLSQNNNVDSLSGLYSRSGVYDYVVNSSLVRVPYQSSGVTLNYILIEA
ncbi:hypothetical protein [Paenibacillus sp. FJAT-27812]|uniref:hypothetical protein n=1 Tax=Paenibacillus sp. FJAT-27812 TaxID=1684143 RepID=UPI0006A7C95A|nr:hypothetical protein [Paenibacillus sp. FJAT-27812]